MISYLSGKIEIISHPGPSLLKGQTDLFIKSFLLKMVEFRNNTIIRNRLIYAMRAPINVIQIRAAVKRFIWKRF
jgi:hypothetical protein